MIAVIEAIRRAFHLMQVDGVSDQDFYERVSPLPNGKGHSVRLLLRDTHAAASSGASNRKQAPIIAEPRAPGVSGQPDERRVDPWPPGATFDQRAEVHLNAA